MPSMKEKYLEELISQARPFLRGELELIDPRVPELLSVLRKAGAGECWHKHGSFLDHLLGTFRILKMWGAQDSVSLCGLFHSTYSNSYVNLAIFELSSSGRASLAAHLGPSAERLVHLFCVVPRHKLIHDDLLFRYTDSELGDHLEASEASVKKAREEEGCLDGMSEEWRRKINEVFPADGVVVEHIKTGEDVRVSRRLVAAFIVMTMADFSDQIFGFQDVLFENTDGRLEFKGSNISGALWPGNGKPGLWMNSMSRMGALYTLIAREEEIFAKERKKNGDYVSSVERDEDLELVIPPVFQHCTKVLNAEDQISARDLYWEAICGETGGARAEELLLRCAEKNPFIGEPRVVLGQVYIGQGRFEEGEREAKRGLMLILEWGTSWDKRMSWEDWVAWARVLILSAKDKTWPTQPWGILNLGLVK